MEAVPASDLVPLRPLGNLEKYSTTRSHLGIYLNVGLTARYKRPSGAPVKPALFRALSILISKHPILSAIPAAIETPNPYWVRLPQITLCEVVKFDEDNAYSRGSSAREYLDDVIEEQHNRPFERSLSQILPFWRICVVERSELPIDFDLVFIFHHSLMDTKSAMSFHEELERYMAEDDGSDLVIDVVETPPMPLLPSLEELYTLAVSEEFAGSQEMPSMPVPDSWTAAPQTVPVKTCFSSLWLSTAQSRKLKNMSRKEKTSVTAALQTLIAASLFSVLPLRYHTLQTECAVSLRRFLQDPVTGTSLGCYVGTLSIPYSRIPSFTWSEARRTKEIIEQVIAKKGGDMPVGYLQHVPNMHQWMLRKLGHTRASGFELSNVGRVSDPQGGYRFEIQGMLFSQSSSACSAAIKVSAVTGRDGRSVLGFTWQEGIVESDMIEQIKEALQAQVEGLTMER
ncbi:alcohol acetyltransferase [Aspergillus pseudoustus]|uniref:Alcohol acetyltransferase n=1 Tax=Aspergillus pseudoustus TaxID=1810923 RepID=A0ABR4JQW5_9EURO